MVKSEKTKSKARWEWFGGPRSSGRRKPDERSPLAKFSAVFGAICSIITACFFFYLAERYIKSSVPVPTGPLELVDVPDWVGEELKMRLIAAAGGRTFRLDENAAHLTAENLSSFSWLANVEVQTAHDRLLVRGTWRRPLGFVKHGLRTFYVDADMVTLDFVPVPKLATVRIDGLSAIPRTEPGQLCQADDLAAAMTILVKLDQMDARVTPDKPLLFEIESIDVSNFNGRRSTKLPHIVLYAKDKTQIIWGAEFGTWQQYLEAPDDEKLAKLYSFYEEYGSILNGAKYINLRDPQQTVLTPVDKY